MSVKMKDASFLGSYNDDLFEAKFKKGSVDLFRMGKQQDVHILDNYQTLVKERLKLNIPFQFTGKLVGITRPIRNSIYNSVIKGAKLPTKLRLKCSVLYERIFRYSFW